MLKDSSVTYYTDEPMPSASVRTTRPYKTVPITVAYGDGIGPEIMDATLRVLEAAGAKLKVHPIEIGEKIYRSDVSSGISSESWNLLRQTKVFLKAPIATPEGEGHKSLNVTVRKSLGLYANVRPCIAYSPAIVTKHPTMNVIVIRENEEDLYAGIEHRQTEQTVQAIKLISRPGCERIVRYAFEYAKANGRRKVSCFTKDNILKMSDGLFRNVFEEIAKDYPDIESEHMIVDIGAAKLADKPEQFDVLVLPNLYGDILSDVAAQLAGSIGLAASANVGDHGAMFEAVHDSAPSRAGQNLANPSGLLLASVMMLNHIGQQSVANKVFNAWLKTIEDGVHTYDIYRDGYSKIKVGTKQFAEAVMVRLGESPNKLKVGSYPFAVPQLAVHGLSKRPKNTQQATIGVDVFMQWPGNDPDSFIKQVKALENGIFDLQMVTNRGTKIWPDGLPETFCTDHWRCRFMAKNPQKVDYAAILELLGRITQAKLNIIKTENLYAFDGQPGFSLGQGQ